MVTEQLISRDAQHRWLTLVLLGLVAAALDSLSLYLAHYGAHIVTIWPAKGLVLAACLSVRPKAQPGIIVAAFLAGVATKVLFGSTVLAAVLGTTVSLTGTLAMLWLATRIMGAQIDFRVWKVLATYLLIVFVTAVVLGALGGMYLSLDRSENFLTAWLSWSLSSGLSYAILTPLIVLLGSSERRQERNPVQVRSVVVAAFAMLVLSIGVYSQSMLPLTYLLPLGLVVVALETGLEGTVVCLLLTAVVAVAFTALGMGPTNFLHMAPAIRVIAAQVFVAAMTITMLPVAAALGERNRLRASLAAALARAEIAASRLRESEAHHRLLAEQSRDIIVRAGPDNVIRYISPSCRTFGYEPHELVGMRGDSLVHPDDLAGYIENGIALFRGELGGKERNREHRHRTKSGDWVWLQGNPAIVRDENGAPVEVVNVFRDVTEQRQTNAKLADALRAAEAAAEAKSEFLANMSHELRTPLTSIIGFSQLLKEQPELGETARQFAERVVQGSQALLAIVNDVLDFSKLEAGQVELKPQPVSPADLAGNVLQLFAPQAEAKSIALVLQAEHVPPSLMLDEDRVRQVLLNLIGNAVKFTDEGTVTVRVSYSDGTLRCEVADTGAGIPPARLDRLFQRFSQVDGSAKRAHGGTGLGLAICKGLAETMGGRVFASSSEGSGSIFGFEIPAVSCSAENSEMPASPSGSLEGLRILAADDNLANRTLLAAMLTPLGVELTVAADGHEAIARADSEVFDAILMDIHMPDMSGFDAARTIRRSGGLNANARILAFTADAVRDLAGLGDEKVFDGVVLKPVTSAALTLAISRAATPIRTLSPDQGFGRVA